jgi:ABC-type polysaccharide/polyol phosphate export permease
MVWFWVTPIFYSLDMLRFPYRWVCLFNPVTYYVISCRAVLFAGSIPGPKIVLASIAIAVGFFITGYIYFLKQEPQLLKKV